MYKQNWIHSAWPNIMYLSLSENHKTWKTHIRRPLYHKSTSGWIISVNMWRCTVCECPKRWQVWVSKNVSYIWRLFWKGLDITLYSIRTIEYFIPIHTDCFSANGGGKPARNWWEHAWITIAQPLKLVMLLNSGVIFLHGAIFFMPICNCFIASIFFTALSVGFSDFVDATWI